MRPKGELSVVAITSLENSGPVLLSPGAATHGNTATGKKRDRQAASLLESTLFLE